MHEHEHDESDVDPLLGRKVGNYVVKSKLGEGGMGAVYLAEHPLIGKKVALKVLHPELSSKKDVVERFFHEAKAVNDIQHPNIVDIIDYGVVQGESRGDTLVYFIMEFLGGRSLTLLLDQEAPLPAERALHISLQIADALAASHKNGIVHRDLKPDNVMLVEKRHQADFVKVLDFGIAKLTGEGHQSRKTRTGIVMGTPAYMSPEQCEGKGNIDHRTDVYALGILLYQMLTGRVPFQGEGYGEVLVQHLTQPPIPPSQITGAMQPHLEQVVLKSLEKGKDARFPSMDEMIRALLDPIGYVESHGGLGSFLGTQLTESAGPSPNIHPRAGSVVPTPQPFHGGVIGTPMPGQLSPVPGSLRTPMPGNPQQATGGITGAHTPVPGQMHTPQPGHMHSPVPGQMHTPAPGQMHSPVPGQVQPTVWPDKGKPNRTFIYILAALLVVGGGLGIVIASSMGGNDGTEAAAPTEPVQPLAETTPVVNPENQAGAKADAAAPKPELLKMSFNSTPTGAQVFLNNELRGITPVEIEVEESDEELAVRFVLTGYESETRTLKLDRSSNIDVSLKAVVAATKEEPAKKSRSNRSRRDRKTKSSSKKTGSATKSAPKTGDAKTGTKKKRYDNTGVLRPTL